ncbi:hypothetical protein [uncultured Aquimarina sp.]|uniref:hypothetical protein n=1 Tax=uncultured Aquimarina sp. TaxID=575652 RepID=UPI00260AE067|nr:hypothetical protein [uncultured Aquimarina sp.]
MVNQLSNICNYLIFHNSFLEFVSNPLEYEVDIKNINDPFTWEAEKGKIMLGLGYIGLMDEIAIFDKSLNLEEITTVYGLKSGIKTLFK